MEYSVIVPAYNEESRITSTLTQIIGFMKTFSSSFEIIVSDDGSKDSTIEVIENYAKSHPQISVVRNSHKGKGFAVRSGVLKSTGKYVLMADADMATPIEELKRLSVWAVDQDFDVVISSREGVGAKRQNEPFKRHLMGRVFNLIIRIMTGLGIQDTQNGFKLFKGEVARKVFDRMILFGPNAPDLRVPRVSAFDVEVLIIAKRLGYKIKEIPVTWTYVPTNRVNLFRDSFLNFWDVSRIKFNDMRGKYGKQK